MESYVPPEPTEEEVSAAEPKKKKIGKRELARKEKEKAARKKKRQEEAEKAELKAEVSRVWNAILEIEFDGEVYIKMKPF